MTVVEMQTKSAFSRTYGWEPACIATIPSNPTLESSAFGRTEKHTRIHNQATRTLNKYIQGDIIDSENCRYSDY